MKRRKYALPEDTLAKEAIAGDIAALFGLREHYDRLMRYAVNREIQTASEIYGLEAHLYDFDDLLGDLGIIFDNAVMDFEKIED